MKKAKTKAPARKAAKATRSVAKAPARKATKQAAKPVAKKAKVTRPPTSKSPSTFAKAAKPASAAKVIKPDMPLVRPAGVPSSPPLTLPAAKPVQPAPAASPASLPSSAALPKAPAIAPKPATAPRVSITAPKPKLRADVPPVEGFAILVDGHFKNQFETLADAKGAATELKSRFPILRIEIYDAVKKARLPI